MDATFWAGAVVGAFFGLVFTFLARPIERALDRHGDRIARERGAQILAADSRDKQATRDYLVIQLIEIAVVGAVAGVGAGICFAIQAVVAFMPRMDGGDTVQMSLVVVGQGIAILGAAVVLRIATTASRTARLLRDGKVRKPTV